jgi:hypothetical protein
MIHVPARNEQIEPIDGGEAERDAERERTNIVNHMAWLQNRYDAVRGENAALRADNWRLITANASLIRAADIGRSLTEQPPEAAPPDVDDLAPGHPLRLRKIIEALKPTPQWLSIKHAAHRSSCSVARMGQLRKTNKVIWRRDDGSIFILTASIDERLRSLCRTPRI